MLVVCGFVDVRIGILIPWWARHHRTLGTWYGPRAMAVPGDGAVDHLLPWLAFGMVRDPDYLRSNLPANAGYLRREPLLLRDVGGTEPSDLVPDTTYGYVGVLPKRGAKGPDRADGYLQRYHAVSGYRDLQYDPDVPVPGYRALAT